MAKDVVIHTVTLRVCSAETVQYNRSL